MMSLIQFKDFAMGFLVLGLTFGLLPQAVASPGTMTVTGDYRLDSGDLKTCRDDLLEGVSSGQGQGWEDGVCEVQETTIECNGDAFGSCVCRQIMRIDARSVEEPPFDPDVDPAECYPVAIDLECISYSESNLVHALLSGKFCVLETGPAMTAFGSGILMDRRDGRVTGVIEISGSVAESEESRTFNISAEMKWNNVKN